MALSLCPAAAATAKSGPASSLPSASIADSMSARVGRTPSRSGPELFGGLPMMAHYINDRLKYTPYLLGCLL